MRLRFAIIFGITALVLLAAVDAVSGPAKLSPRLQSLDRRAADSDSLIEVVVFLEDRSAQDNLPYAVSRPHMKRSDRIKSVLSRLSSARANGSSEIEDFLNSFGHGESRRFWIVPAYAVTLPVSRIDELAAMETVRMIVENVSLSFDEPVDVLAAGELSTSSASTQLNLLNVPYLWQRGLTGSGRLVCSFDTGVEGSHPALASKWRGTHAPVSESWFSPVNPNATPYDVAGHGTHTMGIMVGSNATDTFGVAPGAEWITAGVIDQGRTFNTTLADIIAAFQWVLNPDGDVNTTDDVPDVILNSWGIPAGLFAPCDPTFWGVIDAVEAAGIVTVFAAGNEGPNAQTLRDPADRATTPLNSFSVGAVDNSRQIASFSSRGPSRCSPGEIKPEVVAPGVTVYSSTKGGTYAFMSGTSMAAPYIAGLVALCRQYNPDATVEEIKNAFLQSTVDLGPVGEDNAYGHGIVDASLLLEHLPMPGGYMFVMNGDPYLPDGVALPGNDVSMQILLTSTTGNANQITGRLVSDDPAIASVLDSIKTFWFGSGATTALNQTPFTIRLAADLVHGSEADFTLYLALENGTVVDTLTFGVTAGYPSPGATLDHEGGSLQWTVSDFGQYGFAAGSIYNLGGTGFSAFGGENLLYEAGIVVGRNSLQLASSLRAEDGAFRPSDFTPTRAIASARQDDDGAVHYTAEFVDTYADIPIPVAIHQTTTHFTNEVSGGVALVRYRLINDSIERLTHVSFGFLADFDLSDHADRLQFDPTAGLLWQTNDSGLLVGLLALNGLDAFHGMSNGDAKSGFSATEQYDLISAAVSRMDDSTTGDMIMMISSGEFDIEVGQSVEVAFAIVVGRTITELYGAVEDARHAYDISTPVDDGRRDQLPQAFVLEQNYPNPFNPVTTIAFSLPAASDVRLEVFNTLGQRVSVLHNGALPAGSHTIEWDSTDDAGRTVASGVYFYRLSSDTHADSRKMILLK
ncbi:MAG: S8 family serine peptidase [candidate division Zixibacteria bacterium]|nr:S8 family serine peptidase [candidate division Zixibacteria bacterium]